MKDGTKAVKKGELSQSPDKDNEGKGVPLPHVVPRELTKYLLEIETCSLPSHLSFALHCITSIYSRHKREGTYLASLSLPFIICFVCPFYLPLPTRFDLL